MIVGGEVWVDAEPARATVRAFVGDVECASGESGTVPDAYIPTVALTIPSALEHQGCGAPGAIIRFEIDGRPAGRLIEWQGGVGSWLTLAVGPEAAVYQGQVRFEDLPVGLRLQPVIEGTSCGRQMNSFQGHGPYFGYEVLVYPEEVVSGCGRPGARIAMHVVDEAGTAVGEVPTIDVPWAPGVKTTIDDADTVVADNVE